MHNFFTKYNKSQNQIFLSLEDSDKFISIGDLVSHGKNITYKGIPKYDYERINLFPFPVEIDFTMNANYDEAEKKRMSVPKWIKAETVNLIAIYEKITGKTKGYNYSTTICGSSLVRDKICTKQSGISGRIGRLYYSAKDIEVISFFESRGYKTVKNSNNQKDRVSFIKDINSEQEGNQMLEDIYDFDKQFKNRSDD